MNGQDDDDNDDYVYGKLFKKFLEDYKDELENYSSEYETLKKKINKHVPEIVDKMYSDKYVPPELKDIISSYLMG